MYYAIGAAVAGTAAVGSYVACKKCKKPAANSSEKVQPAVEKKVGTDKSQADQINPVPRKNIFSRTIGKIWPSNVMSRLAYAMKFGIYNYLPPAIAGGVFSALGAITAAEMQSVAQARLGSENCLFGDDSCLADTLAGGGTGNYALQGAVSGGGLFAGKDLIQWGLRKMTGYRPELNDALGRQVKANMAAIGANADNINTMQDEVNGLKDALPKRSETDGGTKRPQRH
ncbi:hypothetical protein [Sansalvadorimonas verongulae]|uniref:hypothetical protein n=1 Tax=Sansalvadorimonas verongulae TaxID=2172824 RepID=UPI0012BC1241|nr:hypothetical protein [Sansalvadorimonas verongulae]MTI12280.1 hypothetical protein [Sansalvadorimonas verongulae]